MKSRGLVLGKFLPPHAGHLRLIDFAGSFVDELHVVVASLPHESIPGSMRHAWMEELAPFARVFHLTDELPSSPEDDPEFWTLWRTSLLGVIGEPPTHVFASEDYGANLAEALGATFIPLPRSGPGSSGPLATSGTEIRGAPWEHWQHIPSAVRPYFLRRIHVTGPESAGKTTLAAKLANAFDTVWVPEYARAWLTRPGAPMEGDVARVRSEDMVTIVRGHRASTRALERAATKRLFSDTDALATVLWSELLLGAVPEPVRRCAESESPDLTLLLAPDTPFVADPVRYAPAKRQAFFDRYRDALKSTGRPFIVIDGSFAEREAKAIDAVHRIAPPAPLP